MFNSSFLCILLNSTMEELLKLVYFTIVAKVVEYGTFVAVWCYHFLPLNTVLVSFHCFKKP